MKKEYTFKYSKIEKRHKIADIDHKIIREVLKQELEENRIEITTLTDIPTKTGLGSSGSFSTALIKAMNYYKKKKLIKEN